MKRVLRVLSIQKPCPASWDAMETRDSGKRFCRVCDKYVHDLTMLKVEEVEALMASGRFCGRVKTSAALPVVAAASAALVFSLTAACSGAEDGAPDPTVIGAPRAPAVQQPAAAPEGGAPAAPELYMLGDVDVAH